MNIKPHDNKITINAVHGNKVNETARRHKAAHGEPPPARQQGERTGARRDARPTEKTVRIKLCERRRDAFVVKLSAAMSNEAPRRNSTLPNGNQCAARLFIAAAACSLPIKLSRDSLVVIEPASKHSLLCVVFL